MEVTSKPEQELRSKIGRIATAIAFAFVICSVAAGPARADDHGDYGHDNRGGDHHHDRHDRGRRGPDVYYSSQPDYYYAPQPNYYNAPEPNYYYSQPEPQPPGIRLFFGD